MRGGKPSSIEIPVFLSFGLALSFAAPVSSQSGPIIPEMPPIQAGVAPAPGPYLPGFDAEHYEAEIVLSENSRVVEGRVLLRVRRTDPSLDLLPLDFSGLAVREVRVNGRPAEAASVEGKLRVRIPGDGADEEALEVLVHYSGTPDDGLIIQENVHGAPSAFVDNWPNRTRFWLPTIDHPSDKATLRFTVHAPRGWEIIANGRLRSGPTPSTDSDLGGAGRDTWIWESDVPHPTYTMVLGAADMAVEEVGLAACGRADASPREDGCIEVSYWVFPEDTAHAAVVFRRAARMVDYFAELVGPFPYEKLANVQSSTRFGGMENASAIFYSETTIANGADIEGTVSHEIAHQWFGDSVTESTWHDLWLSEGFATYFGALFFEQAEGVEDFRRRMRSTANTYLNSPDVNRPVIDPTESDLFALLNRNNYQKGAWVLHMLRRELGDEAFFEGIRTYYSAHKNATADTDDLRAAMESAHGEELGWFFEQWLLHPGYPEVGVTRSYDESAGELVLTLRQTQDSSWPVFRIPVDIELRSTDGSASRSTHLLDAREQTVRIPVSSDPADVVLDPDAWVLGIFGTR